MGKMDRYDCGYPGSKDEISGNGLPNESTGNSKKPPFPGYSFIDAILGNKPPYNQTGAY